MKLVWTVLLLSVLHASADQAPALLGSWEVYYAAGTRIENDIATPIMATGVRRIRSEKDSIVGELLQDSLPDRPTRRTARLAGTMNGEAALLVSRGTATVRTNHGQSEATIVSTWRLEARGDSLVGTVERRVEGLEGANAGPQPVAGHRKH